MATETQKTNEKKAKRGGPKGPRATVVQMLAELSNSPAGRAKAIAIAKSLSEVEGKFVAAKAERKELRKSLVKAVKAVKALN